MATTGTYNFTVSRDDIINAALRSLQVLDGSSTASSSDLINATQALNLIMKSWASKGLPIWTIQWIQIPMVADKISYTIGTSLGADLVLPYRPSRVFSGFLRFTQSNTDVSLLQMSRSDYELLGYKTSPSIVNQFYYDNQLPNPVVYVYSAPSTSSQTVAWFSVQRPVMDITSAADNFDVPQEWFMALKWALVEELAMEYGVDDTMYQLSARKAQMYLEQAFDMSQDTASIQFTMDPQTYYQNGMSY